MTCCYLENTTMLPTVRAGEVGEGGWEKGVAQAQKSPSVIQAYDSFYLRGRQC